MCYATRTLDQIKQCLTNTNIYILYTFLPPPGYGEDDYLGGSFTHHYNILTNDLRLLLILLWGALADCPGSALFYNILLTYS